MQAIQCLQLVFFVLLGRTLHHQVCESIQAISWCSILDYHRKGRHSRCATVVALSQLPGGCSQIPTMTNQVAMNLKLYAINSYHAMTRDGSLRVPVDGLAYSCCWRETCSRPFTSSFLFSRSLPSHHTHYHVHMVSTHLHSDSFGITHPHTHLPLPLLGRGIRLHSLWPSVPAWLCHKQSGM